MEIYCLSCKKGGSNPIFAHGKMCVFPWEKMGKKVYGKRGK